MRSTRRMVGVFVVAGLIAAGLASNAQGAEPSRTSAAGIDKQGVLHLGFDMTQNLVQFNLSKITAVGVQYQNLIYGTLLRMTPSGKVVPDLAKSVTIVDPQTIKVVLKPGLKFTDGTPVDAAAYKFTIDRSLAQGPRGGPEAKLFEIASVTVDAPLAFTVKIKTPIASAIYRLMRLCEVGCPVSPTAVNKGVDFSKNPVGAGPFKLDSITPGQNFKLVKNPDYWDAKDIKLAGIEYQHVPGTAVVTALRAGELDYSLISLLQSQQLGGAPGLDTVSKSTDNTLVQGSICKNKPPFNDIRVREAVNYATDRKALNELLYQGAGAPMWGFYKSDSVNYDKGLVDYYKTNIPKAKKLLKEAGVPNLSFTMYFLPGDPDSERGAEIVQQQWAKAGITAKLQPFVATFFTDPNAAPIYWLALQRSGPAKVTRMYVPGNFGDVCNWNDPKLNALMTQIQGLPEGSAAAAVLWKKVSARALKTAVTIFGVFGTQSYAFNTDHVGNAKVDEGRMGTSEPYVWGMFIKKT